MGLGRAVLDLLGGLALWTGHSATPDETISEADFTVNDEQPIDIHQYTRAIRYALPQILVLAVITSVLVVVASSVALPARAYTATTTILARDTLSADGLTDSTTVTRRLATVNLLTRTTNVLAAAASKLKGTTVAELRADVHSSVDPEANVITVDATADTARVAAARANEVAAALIATESQIEQQAAKGTLAEALAQVGELRAAGASPAEIQAAENRLASLAANSVGSASGFQVVQSAEPPARPTSPPVWFSGLVGFLAVGVLGMLVVLAREQIAPRISSSQELHRVFGMPVLASIPVSRKARGKELALLPQAARDAFYVLAASVRQRSRKRGTRIVFVVSAVRGEGRTTVAANLAQALSTGGARVLALSADLRSPKLHEFLEAPESPGLSDVIAKARQEAGVVGVPAARLAPQPGDLERTIRATISTKTRKLHVLSSGTAAEDPTQLFFSDVIPSVFKALRTLRYDFVIVDTPPGLGVPDLQALAAHADAFVAVARANRVRASEAVELRELLDAFGKEGLGVAVFERSAHAIFYPTLEKADAPEVHRNGAAADEREVVEIR